MRKTKIRITSLIMALVMLISVIPFSVLATEPELADKIISVFTGNDAEDLSIATVSDIHYYSPSLNGGKNDAYMEMVDGSTTTFDLSEPALDAALASLKIELKDRENPYLLIPGDITNQGEYQSHLDVVEKLTQWEKDTGIEVLVINGNHDINNLKACTYVNGKKEAARATTPEEFLYLYSELGYDLAYHTYIPENGKYGMCSYSVRLDGGYRMILMDTNKYSADITEDGLDDHETAGYMSEELFEWVLNECEDAKNCGEEIIGVTHCGLLEHINSYQEKIFFPFILNNWEHFAGELADAGMHFMFNGHQHSSDIVSYVSDNGETIYECETPPAATYPCGMYVTDFSSRNGKIKAEYNYFDVDEIVPAVIDGVTLTEPIKYTSFRMGFGNGNIADLAVKVIDYNLAPFLKKVQEDGGIVNFIEHTLGESIEDFMSHYFSGLSIGGVDIFTGKNIANFAEDLVNQFSDRYLTDQAYRDEFLGNVVTKLASLQVTDTPCSAYVDTLGFGDKNKPGTLQDAVYTVLHYIYSGNDTARQDEFLQEFISNLRDDTALTKELVALLIDIILDDIVQDEILSNLEFNFDALFPEGSFGHYFGEAVGAIITALLGGDSSYQAIVEAVFSLGLFPYGNVRELLDHYMTEYFTESQYQAIGMEIASIIEGFCIDTTPMEHGDRDVSYTYTGPVEVEATQENYRLPSIVTTTFGDDETSFNISWYTKQTVTGTDIEIVPYSSNPEFTGMPTTGDNIVASTELKTREFPGIDVGVIGILTVEKELNRHIIKISGLEAGTKYCYRVGDASRGWWSEAGVLETQDNSDKVTFLHVSDSQSQNSLQYDTWKNVLGTAFEMYPDTDFVLNTGDIVDLGSNLKQWAWAINNPSETLMKTVMMPVAGNHDVAMGSEYALADNFVISNAPKQDLSTGIYYSFDYNNVHIAVLNTNDLNESEALTDTQIEWLKDDMNSSDATWKFVALHKAIYSNGSHYDDDDVIAMRKQLSKLMPDLDIDMVFQGHDHVYLRTDAMDNNKVVSPKTKEITFNGTTYSSKIDPQGSIYVISACSGVKYYLTKDPALTDELFPRAEKIVDCQSPVFSSIQIDGNNLYFDAYTVNSDDTENIDSFAITKTPMQEIKDDICTAIDDFFTAILGDFWTIPKSIFETVIDTFKEIITML